MATRAYIIELDEDFEKKLRVLGETAGLEKYEPADIIRFVVDDAYEQIVGANDPSPDAHLTQADMQRALQGVLQPSIQRNLKVKPSAVDRVVEEVSYEKRFERIKLANPGDPNILMVEDMKDDQALWKRALVTVYEVGTLRGFSAWVLVERTFRLLKPDHGEKPIDTSSKA